MTFRSSYVVKYLFAGGTHFCFRIMILIFYFFASTEALTEEPYARTAGGKTPSVKQQDTAIDDAGYGCPVDVLSRYWQDIDGATESDRAIKTEILARTLMPDFMADYKSELPERGWWCLQCITEDLDGDDEAEHILLFWDKFECDSAFCVVQGSRVIHGDTLQVWSYSSPTMSVVTNQQAGKLIVFSRTTISHCSGLFEKKHTVYRMNNGRLDKVLEVPEVSHCCWLDMNTVLSSAYNGNMRLHITYSYRDGDDCYGAPIVEGEMQVDFEWNEDKGIFEPLFDAGDPSPEVKKFQFLIDQRPPWDAEFEDIWEAELEKQHTSKRHASPADEHL